jgi:hypothetical protein
MGRPCGQAYEADSDPQPLLDSCYRVGLEVVPQGFMLSLASAPVTDLYARGTGGHS